MYILSKFMKIIYWIIFDLELDNFIKVIDKLVVLLYIKDGKLF